MSNIFEKIRNNKHYFVLEFILITLLYTLVFLNKLSKFLNFILIVEGVLIFLSEWKFFVKKSNWIQYVFLLIVFLSSIFNIQSGLLQNIKLLSLTFLQIIILVNIIESLSDIKLKKQ